MRRRRSTIGAGVLLVVSMGCAQAGGAAARPGSTPSAAVGTISTLSGVYTEDQAERGQETYRGTCVACHTPSGHSGDEFSRGWENRSAWDLFDMITTDMPNDNPGSLSRKQYIELVAYLFKLNGYPAGKEPLSAERGDLQQIRIEGPTRRR